MADPCTGLGTVVGNNAVGPLMRAAIFPGFSVPAAETCLDVAVVLLAVCGLRPLANFPRALKTALAPLDVCTVLACWDLTNSKTFFSASLGVTGGLSAPIRPQTGHAHRSPLSGDSALYRSWFGSRADFSTGGAC